MGIRTGYIYSARNILARDVINKVSKFSLATLYEVYGKRGALIFCLLKDSTKAIIAASLICNLVWGKVRKILWFYQFYL